MGDLLTGAGLGGVLAIGFAALALLTFLRDQPTADHRVRSVRLLTGSFIAGGGALGLVIVFLAATFGGQSRALIGLAGGLGMGLGSFLVRRAGMGFERAILSEDPLRARARTILQMAMAQGLTVLSAVGLILAIEL